MDIFESLENLNVSEECFDDIVTMVEAMLNEDVEDSSKLTKLQRGALKTDKHRGVRSRYTLAIMNGTGNQLDPNTPLRNEKRKETIKDKIGNISRELGYHKGNIKNKITNLKNKYLSPITGKVYTDPPKSWGKMENK